MKKTFSFVVFFLVSILLSGTISHAGIGSKFPIAAAAANLAIPTATITVDGNTADWTGISPLAIDPQGDTLLSYTGDDIKALYAAKDATNLYIRLDLWENANTSFGNGPAPNEGSYRFSISSNSGTYPNVGLGLAYAFCGQWSLGCNGSNGSAPASLQGPGYVKVSGKIIELRVPLSVIGNPTIFTGIAAEVNNCCVSNWATSDTGTAETAGREMALSAAFDGTNFMVGIQGDAFDHSAITAQLLSQAGSLVGPRITIPDHTGGAPRVAFDGTNYLLIWQDDSTYPNDKLYGQFVGTAGSLVNSPFVISPDILHSGEIGGMAFGGGTYLVAYYKLAEPVTEKDAVYGRLVSSSGTVGSEITISSVFGKQGFNNVAFDGSNFLVVWTDDTNDYQVKGRFISSTGTIGTEFSINASTFPSDNPLTVAFGGTNYLVAWTDEVGGYGSGEWDIFGQLVDKSGNKVGGVINISTAPGQQFLPTIAFDGTNYLVTWTDMRNDANHNWACDAGEGTCWDIYGQYVSKTGTLVGSEFPANKDTGNQFGGLAFGGGKALALANNIDTFDGEIGDVYGMFISKGPNPPANLKATSLSADSIKLTWTDNSTDETGFRIYKKVGAGAWTLLTTTNLNATSYSDAAATGNAATKPYSYYVSACKNAACSQTPPAIVPFRPVSLAANAVSSSRIDLSWTDKSGNETGFQIYRKAGDCASANTWGLIAAKGQNVTSHSNTGLTSDTTYSYKVRAYKRSPATPYSFGYSLWSACAQATTQFNNTVTIEGNVYVEGTSTPVAGAVVSTSLDSRTATTNASGHFSLQTNTPADYCCTPYTITISAAGYQTFSSSWVWGDHPTGQVFYLHP